MKASILILFIILSLNLYSQETGIKFRNDSTLTKAMETSKIEGKYLFIDCYTVWCGPCKWLVKDVFVQKEVGDFYNQNFINLTFDMETPEGIKIKERYNVERYPTLLYLNSNGELLMRFVGAPPANFLVEIGKTAKDSTKNYIACVKKIKNGDRSAEVINTYLRVNTNAQNKDSLLNDYFNSITEEEKFSPISWHLFFNYIYDIDQSQFKFFIKNKSIFAEKYGLADIEQKLFNVFEYYFKEYASDTVKMKSLKSIDLSLYNKIQYQMEFDAASSLIQNDKQNKDLWNNFIIKSKEYLPQFETDMLVLNNVCWFIYENYNSFNDTLALKQAKEWSYKTYLSSPENSPFNDTYAHILFELGYVKEAIKHEEFALEQGKKEKSADEKYYSDELDRFKKVIY